MKTLRIYLCGPMTGIPDYNRAAFTEAAERIRALGHIAVNPHDVCGALQIPDGDWNACLRADIVELMGCDAVCLLPGWIYSKGAMIEHNLATSLSMACRCIEGFEKAGGA